MCDKLSVGQENRHFKHQSTQQNNYKDLCLWRLKWKHNVALTKSFNGN